MSDRTCGSCTACCKTHPIAELNNPAGVWCQHCDVGKGCRIYERRPQECIDFQCDWLLGDFAEDDRPDIVKVVVGDLTAPGFGPMPALYEVTQGALDGNFARKMTEQAIRKGLFICHLPLQGANKIYIPAEKRHLYGDGQVYFPINLRETQIVHYKSGK